MPVNDQILNVLGESVVMPDLQFRSLGAKHFLQYSGEFTIPAPTSAPTPFSALEERSPACVIFAAALLKSASGY